MLIVFSTAGCSIAKAVTADLQTPDSTCKWFAQNTLLFPLDAITDHR